jgi:hypothetical protein
MASFRPDSDVLSNEQINAKLEEPNRQQAAVKEHLRTVLGDATNQLKVSSENS